MFHLLRQNEHYRDPNQLKTNPTATYAEREDVGGKPLTDDREEWPMFSFGSADLPFQGAVKVEGDLQTIQASSTRVTLNFPAQT